MRDFFVRYTIPLLLVVVAVYQMYASYTAHISPWKGGGFGMFSTVSSPRSYFVRVYATADGKTNRVKMPKSCRNDEKNLRYAPSQKKLQILQKSLSKVKWTFEDSLYHDASEKLQQNLPPSSSTLILQKSNFTVELWQYTFSKEKSFLYSSQITSY